MDLAEMQSEFEARKTRTLADKFDFFGLREINRDNDGSPLDEQIELFLDWSSALFRRIPQNWEEYLPQKLADLQHLFDETTKTIRSIEAAGSESLGARGATLSGLRGRIQNVMNRALNSHTELLFLQMIGDDRDAFENSARARSYAAREEMDALIKDATIRAEQLSEMAEASQEATAKIAASGRARVFHTEAKNYQSAARIWLAVTAALGAALILLSFGFALGWFFELESGADAGQIASHLFGKLLILATLGGTVTFAARQYGANRHNAIQNFHRSSALRTYRALLAASRDEAVHEAILHQAAQTIFSPSDTGYSKQATAYDQSPVVQLIQGMSKGSGTPDN